MTPEEFTKKLERLVALSKEWASEKGHEFDSPEEKERKQLFKEIEADYYERNPPPPYYTTPPEYHRTCYICQVIFPTEPECRKHWYTCPQRLMDNEIAEKVMGWVYVVTPIGNRQWYEKDGRTSWWCEHQVDNSWEPTKDLDQAFWVVRTLMEKGYEFKIETSEDGIDGAFVTARTKEKMVHIGYPKEPKKLAFALCEAVLEMLK